ncbi:Uncharacterised protein [Bordetella pertussis]|nr:Uncharacterised protein [Bordetella pertussis]
MCGRPAVTESTINGTWWPRILVQRLVDRCGAAGNDQGVAIRGGAGGLAHADIAAGAGAVLDHDGLFEVGAQFLGQRAGEDVGGLAGRERHEHADRTLGIVGVGGEAGGGQGKTGAQAGENAIHVDCSKDG